MSKWIYGTSDAAVAVIDTVMPGPICGRLPPNTATHAEDDIELVCRASFTASNLQLNISSVDGINTARTRKNGANGSQSVSITSTGLVEDSSNTDSLADGDTFNLQHEGGTMHGNLYSANFSTILLDDAGNDVSMLSSTTHLGHSFSSTTTYYTIGGVLIGLTTEARTQLQIYETSTMSRLRVWVMANAKSGSTSFTTRVNAADGNGTVSFAGAETGAKEDTTNSDSLVADDLIGVAGSSADASTITSSAMQAKLDAAAYPVFGYTGNGASSTTYIGFQSLTNSGTESNRHQEANIADTLKNFRAYINSNNRNGATTYELRDDGAKASGGPTISVPATDTGAFEDTTNTFDTVAADLINYIGVPGGSSGVAVVATRQIQVGAPADASPDWQQQIHQLPPPGFPEVYASGPGPAGYATQ
jgi:hypothetical protein